MIWVSLTVSIFAFWGCSGTMKCVVNGQPGAAIYDSYDNIVGVIGPTGTGEVKLNRAQSHDLLYTMESDTSPKIPLGLNYGRRRNGFRQFMGGLCAPLTFCYSILATVGYIYNNEDVSDELKLNKRQSSNTDLTSVIQNSSNPIDEIKAYKPKARKGATSIKSNNTSNTLSWINEEGEVSELKSISLATIIEENTQPFTGTISFYYPDIANDNKLRIRIQGILDGSEFKYSISLKTPFKKMNGGYEATEKETDSPIKISLLKDGLAKLSFNYEIFEVGIIFNSSSFNKKEISPSKYDYLERLLDAFE